MLDDVIIVPAYRRSFDFYRAPGDISSTAAAAAAAGEVA